MSQKAAAIIVAGGRGVRFGGRVRKQYLSLEGRPLVWWSLKAFQASPSFGAMILVVPTSDVRAVIQRTSRWKMKKLIAVVPGGSTRAQSVRRGLAAVPAAFGWIAVHDGVRPLISSGVIERVLQQARRTRAAIAACLSKDTVKLAHPQGWVRSTPLRSTVWLAQTPQIFQRALLQRAYRQASYETATDDAQLVERLGVRVQLVDSPPENLKVTVPADLEIAKIILKRAR